MAKDKAKNQKKPAKTITNAWYIKQKNALPVFLFCLLIILIILTYQVFISDRFYPFTFVGNTNISFLTPTQTTNKVKQAIDQKLQDKLEFFYTDKRFSIQLSRAILRMDFTPIQNHFNQTHKGNAVEQSTLQLYSLISKKEIAPQISLYLEKNFNEISEKVNTEPENAQLSFNESESSPSSQIQIKEGKNGLSLNNKILEENIINYLLSGKYTKELPVEQSLPKVTTAHVTKLKEVLDINQKQSIKLQFEGSIWVLDTKQLLTLLDLTEGKDILDRKKVELFIEKIAKEINSEVQEGLFEFNPATSRVIAFKPAKKGKKLDQEKTFLAIKQTLLNENTRHIRLPVEVINPTIQTEDVNNLGIKELIGRGVSHFAGSIPNRIYNVGLTARKINGVLVKPGEVFSFNKTVGDISAATGFKQAYVIKEGRTVLDDGGGVCQDSTTLFRAVLNAGLPVLKRTAHAYRVGYYEQGFPPGLDATVFYPSVDFQFKNNTQNHILIQAYTVGTTLYVDLYGTADGRMVTLSKPVITDQTPAPPELRQEDPTLPRGVVKQVDWAAPGAQVNFSRTVTKNGETLISENWKSSYKAWQAVYLVGTQ